MTTTVTPEAKMAAQQQAPASRSSSRPRRRVPIPAGPRYLRRPLDPAGAGDRCSALSIRAERSSALNKRTKTMPMRGVDFKCISSGAHIRSHNLSLQHKLVKAIKDAGNIKGVISGHWKDYG
ncbi:hypothetical protein ZEAMMB73_Zm00001d006575 [Zea mays]|uniref:Uncharacterized protein n=1 Tax=Zea mays TaxID=4577 RepID=A0A1D6EY12_MAIZE|nr:hypothetical protein ZEAMMB73_Zm00001d006575 [Zea mays]ONM24297.1 hypothetical protein ZEAMMB73_Zm00001d006575 [Zea mays]